jgi:SAM-dependent methyltransferase
LAGKYSRVVGVDQSERMIGAAKENHPGIDFRVMDALNMPFVNEFDAVFSNAVFHWIQNQPRLLMQINNALKSGGSLVCEFGAHGNIDRIWTAFNDAMSAHNAPVATRFFYPTAEEYTKLLNEAGFDVKIIYEFDRPTLLGNDDNGMRGWLIQFLVADLDGMDEVVREDVIIQVESALRNTLWDGQRWHADYRRLRAVAFKR